MKETRRRRCYTHFESHRLYTWIERNWKMVESCSYKVLAEYLSRELNLPGLNANHVARRCRDVRNARSQVEENTEWFADYNMFNPANAESKVDMTAHNWDKSIEAMVGRVMARSSRPQQPSPVQVYMITGQP